MHVKPYKKAVVNFCVCRLRFLKVHSFVYHNQDSSDPFVSHDIALHPKSTVVASVHDFTEFRTVRSNTYV